MLIVKFLYYRCILSFDKTNFGTASNSVLGCRSMDELIPTVTRIFTSFQNEAKNIYIYKKALAVWRMEMHSFTKKSKKSVHAIAKMQNMLKYIQLSTFITIVKQAVDIMGSERVFLVDGDQIIKNPEREFGLLLNFFGLKSHLGFEYSDAKGFYCLQKPIPFCLGEGKGTTKGNETDDESLYKKYPAILAWKKSYRNSAFDLFSHIFNCSSIENCCTVTVTRWTWLQPYFC